MTTTKVDRRTLLGGMAGVAAFTAGRAFAASAPPLPSSPVSLNVVDVAGQLQLTQGAMDGVCQGEPEPGVEDHLLAGAGAGAAGQDQGAAGGRTASTSTWC